MKIKQQAGFSLIEVLISIFVLTLGVIGTAGMQLVAMRTSQQSSLQSAAVQLATEMADKMRSNSTQMNQADATNPFLFSHDSATDAQPDAPAGVCYVGEDECTAAEMAAFDIFEWTMRLRELPGGRVAICRDASPWSATDGALAWPCAYGAATANNAPFVIKVGWQGKNPDGSLIRDANRQFPPSIAVTVEPYVR